ncbi:MAG: hypothetical protein V3U76_03890 [Granulosicoccus sp.]
MINKTTYNLVGVITLAAMLIKPTFAGPVELIAGVAFESFWGRILLVLLAVVMLPAVSRLMLHRRIAERRARRDLAFMATHDERFDWTFVQRRAMACFQRVRMGWQDGDFSDADSWMTDWYWQNQRLVHLDRCKREGLINVCRVKYISKLRPLLFIHRNAGCDHGNSVVIISITAKMQDYMIRQCSDQVVAGSLKWKSVESTWTLTMTNGKWKVSGFDAGGSTLRYAKQGKYLPDIESTLAGEVQAYSGNPGLLIDS